MNLIELSKMKTVAGDGDMKFRRAFTLLELLVVVAIISILGAMLLAGLSAAKARAQTTACKNHLSQIGRSLAMYISDYNTYPSALGGGGPPFKTWADQLAPYDTLNWTNRSWHCPTYLAHGGIVEWQPPPPDGGAFKASTSYAYNAFGMWGYQFSGPHGFQKGPWLGLGDLKLTVRDNQILAPSEMYAVADTRPVHFLNTDGFIGAEAMKPWRLLPSALNAKYTEASPPHAQGYDLLFTDAHVDLVKRRDYLYPPRSARHWNRDNQPHPELWSSVSEWVIQN